MLGSEADGRRILCVIPNDTEASALRLSLALAASRYLSPQFGCHSTSYFGILGDIAAVDVVGSAEVMRLMHLHEILEHRW